MSDKDCIKEMTCKCDTKHLAEIRNMVRSVASEYFSDRITIGKVILAVDEAVANVMEHAYDGEIEEGYVHVLIKVEGNDFQVKVIDEGKKFDSTSIKTGCIKEAVNRGQKTGYGIYLIRQIMDEIHYNYVKNVKNELCMIKKIAGVENKAVGELE